MYAVQHLTAAAQVVLLRVIVNFVTRFSTSTNHCLKFLLLPNADAATVMWLLGEKFLVLISY